MSQQNLIDEKKRIIKEINAIEKKSYGKEPQIKYIMGYKIYSDEEGNECWYEVIGGNDHGKMMPSPDLRKFKTSRPYPDDIIHAHINSEMYRKLMRIAEIEKQIS